MHDIYAKFMKQNPTENTRVDQQFELVTQNIGYAIHPTIKARLPANPAIADVGTGSAHFLLQLANEYPRADLHGFDISTALWPERKVRNVTLTNLDFKEPFPPEFHEKFDFVHIRVITPSMEEQDWPVVLRNVLQILKPGGAVQWAEPNWTTTEQLRSKPESTCNGARELSELFKTVLAQKTPYGWSTLPALMEQAGMSGVQRDVVSTDRLPETRWALSVNIMVAMCLFAEIMAKQGAIPLKEQDLERLGIQGFMDIDSGCYVRYDIHTAVGFKRAKAG